MDDSWSEIDLPASITRPVEPGDAGPSRRLAWTSEIGYAAVALYARPLKYSVPTPITGDTVGPDCVFNPSVEGTRHEIENPQRHDPHR